MPKKKAISNATDEQFTLLTKTARDLGATTEFTAVQAGQGLEYLAMAGFSVQDAIKTVPSVLNLAIPGKPRSYASLNALALSILHPIEFCIAYSEPPNCCENSIWKHIILT